MSKHAERKAQPVATGVLAYFPKALKSVAECSVAGNKQHECGDTLKWDRTKSADHADCIVRHLSDHLSGEEIDDDGLLHLQKVAWRSLAALEIYLEGNPVQKIDDPVESSLELSESKEMEHRMKMIGRNGNSGDHYDALKTITDGNKKEPKG